MQTDPLGYFRLDRENSFRKKSTISCGIWPPGALSSPGADDGDSRRWCLLAEIKVDCRGQNCPVPLVETRKALKRAAPGDVVEVTGDHPASKKEIPMAVKALGLELLEVEGEEGGEWRIRIRR